MLDIAICNDDITELQHLSGLLENYCQDRPQFPARIRRFQSLFDLTDRIELGCSFHICLLDYKLRQPWMNGRSAEAALREAAPDLSIISFTGNVQAAFLRPVPEDPLSLDACLVKPISVTDLYGVLDHIAEQRLSQLSIPSLGLPTRQGQRSLPFRQLTRAHYRGHVVSCYMTDGEVVKSAVLRVPFNQIIQPLLQTGNFSWISASCVVNLAFVDALDKDACTVTMSDGVVLPVPRAAFPGLKENLQKYQGFPHP